MYYVLTAIIAVLAWQLITTIVYFASGEKEDAAALTGMGLWALLLNGFGVIWRSIQLAHSRKYNCYQFYGDCKGTHSTYNGWIGNYFMTPKMAERFRVNTDEAPSYSIKLLRTGSQVNPHTTKVACFQSAAMPRIRFRRWIALATIRLGLRNSWLTPRAPQPS